MQLDPVRFKWSIVTNLLVNTLKYCAWTALIHVSLLRLNSTHPMMSMWMFWGKQHQTLSKESNAQSEGPSRQVIAEALVFYHVTHSLFDMQKKMLNLDTASCVSLGELKQIKITVPSFGSIGRQTFKLVLKTYSCTIEFNPVDRIFVDSDCSGADFITPPTISY